MWTVLPLPVQFSGRYGSCVGVRWARVAVEDDVDDDEDDYDDDDDAEDDGLPV